MANDKWLDRFLESIKLKKKEAPIAVGGLIKVPGLVEFDFKCNMLAEGGMLFWAYDLNWNCCKGGEGFEIGLSHNRLRVSDIEGAKISDIKYTLPAGTSPIEEYSILFSFELNKFNCTITPKSSPKSRVRLQVLTQVPKTLRVGTGSPPGAENGVPEDTITNFKIT